MKMNDIKIRLIWLVIRAGRIKARTEEPNSPERNRQMNNAARSLFINDIPNLKVVLQENGNLYVAYELTDERDSSGNRTRAFECKSQDEPKYSLSLTVTFHGNGIVTVMISHSFTDAELAWVEAGEQVLGV